MSFRDLEFLLAIIMPRGLPLQMAKQHSLKARKYRWLERTMFAGILLTWGGAMVHLNFFENWFVIISFYQYYVHRQNLS